MKILVLGGTVFVGRAIVERLLELGHDVSLFHRGVTHKNLFSGVPEYYGDRKEGMVSLPDERWDWVLDTSAYIPREVRIASEATSDRADRYLLISTISVYADQSMPGPHEGSALIELEDPATETVDANTYGGLKVLCEREAARTWGERLTIVRPGIVIGPNDPTDRFTLWATRQGRLPVPDRLDQPIQAIDTRDLASFTAGLVERGITGTFNACGEDSALGEMAAACGVEAQPIPIPEWEKAGLHLPMLLPLDGSSDGIFRTDASRARAQGLSHRPLAYSARDTLAWWHTQGKPGLKTEPDEALVRALIS
ncbi:MAG: epimerase [Fimbriimonadaceae bacterium]